MKVINFGSLNIDHVYQVRRFVRPGETIASDGYKQFCGGKGLNQSVALAQAGVEVFHAGSIGRDGLSLKTLLDQYGVNTSLIEEVEKPSGHGIIQVTPKGENAIIIHSGANLSVTPAQIEKVMNRAVPGDYLLLQNEINAIPEIMTRGAELGLHIVFNPAPMDKRVKDYPLALVNCFILNEIEGGELAGEKEPGRTLDALADRYPLATVVLTLGAEGVLFADSAQRLRVPAYRVKPVDATAAGDTFIGFFIAEIIKGRDAAQALRTACKAAALSVARPGAADSIPKMEEVEGTILPEA